MRKETERLGETWDERATQGSRPGGTLNGPVDEERPRAVSDAVEPAVVAVLQDPQEQERPQPAARTRVSVRSH